MSQRTKTAVFAVISMTISLALCLIFFEYVAAYFFYSDTQESIDKDFDPALGWRYTPGNYRMKPDSSFVTHTIRINRLGLRGPDPDPGASGTRVIVLGDSFTFARHVAESDMFTAQLQSILDSDKPAGYRVINAGVEGYGTAQQLLLMRELRQAGIVGDVYVLQVFTNDVLDNLRLDYDSMATNRLRPGYRLEQDGSLRLEHLPDRNEWRGGEEPRGMPLRTAQILRGAIESFAQSRPELVEAATRLGFSVSLPRKPGLISSWYNDDIIRSGMPLMTALIRQLKAEVEQQGATLLMVSIPSPLMVYPETYRPILSGNFPDDAEVQAFLADPGKPARILRQVGEQAGVEVLDMHAILVEKASGTLYFPRDGHLQTDGHALVAEGLAKRLAAIHGR